MSETRPLTPAQQQTASELPWYRDWLLSTGRAEEEVDPRRYAATEEDWQAEHEMMD